MYLIDSKRGATRSKDAQRREEGSGRGAARAEDAQGTPTQRNILPSILAYEDRLIVVVHSVGIVQLIACPDRVRSPLPSEKGTAQKGLETFACKMAQAKARIWPRLSYLCRTRSKTLNPLERFHFRAKKEQVATFQGRLPERLSRPESGFEKARIWR